MAARTVAKKRLWSACLWVVPLLMMGCKEPKSAPQPPADTRHVITVEGSTVRYNGQVLPWDVTPGRWQQILGPRSRLVDGISVWDELGVFLYHQGARPDATRPSAFEVLFGRTRQSPLTETEPAFWPRKTFPGRLVVDGAVIAKGSTLSDINSINRDKQGESFMPSYNPTVYRYMLENGFYVGLGFGHDRSLTSFTIGPPVPESAEPESAKD